VFPSVTFSFNLAPGVALGDAVKVINERRRRPACPRPSPAPSAAPRRPSRLAVLRTLLLAAAVAAVYVVLGILYESYIHPITILSTLPSAGVGALLALLLTHTELSIIALIGIILLIGIVKKNAIMMIDFALEVERAKTSRPRKPFFKPACCASGPS
jgi:multidrug efflux pump